MRRIILAAVTALCLSACATQVGNSFDWAQVDTLKPGVSTKDEAVAKLGAPMAVSNYPDGSVLLQWQYARGTVAGGSGAHAAILFGADGTMIRVTMLSHT